LARESIVSIKKLDIHLVRNVLDETASGIFA
jgi:hypothetical protein